ncbi:MAG: phosphoribosylformylglycinamidine cyclo-ligase [Verrucomicrobia bacterium]|nr:phosphoribosylformylglycinamidine cyclo-ligase [Verrucomicrobiota bacterium]MCG2679035.1 phosphoribosylformylglycinamidine cyclo-ligase [Kiritimatiellia bacterium]MBU4247849.1 phosphoribosylformylglycinamidine cyclo-ligase [Verrucomicrobiota bacterium]MBU4291658.1 phosphoribosylformylglycinamidine cyclo-ligase [Verrucomicrobiota bacterium]MBU4427823.1 phosphoribosylformylglycinamidine cyclo-ligase [Verrucomicrobiota bacterium]
MKKTSSAYTAAGVNIDNKMSALKAVKKMVKTTAVPGLLSEIGAFGGMFAAPGRDKALIASTDGVGTKLKVAVMAGRHDTVGQDIVNHCVNDILVHGAAPLFFLDYFGTARFQANAFKQVVAGICKACRENHCALIGGETAEMPGLYPPGEYDLVGTIVGVMDRKKIITGKTIRPGDILIGLPSSGLHTNGYSLARKIIFDKAGLGIRDKFPGANRSVADVLLAVHRSYLKPVQRLTCPPGRAQRGRLVKRVVIRGMAHITGGGFPDNVARVLPKSVNAVFDRSSWTVPPVFRFLQERGRVDRDEMYRVFNMGIGLVIVVRPADKKTALTVLKQAKAGPVEIGWIENGSGIVRLIN